MGGGGGGGAQLDATNPITPDEVSSTSDWTQPGTQDLGGFGVAPEVQQFYNPNAGVQTGLPQGGFAAPGIAQYFAGTGQQGGGISYDAGAHDPWLGEVAQDAQDTADTYVAMSTPDDVPPEGGGDSPELWQPGTVETLGGNELAYDSQHEEQLAGNIQEIIAEGGINPETGDPNIVAGPNVLSAADEGFFGFGSDYNEEFGENYDAQLAHATDNPYGQTTGTPIYDQGYAEDGDIIANMLNNSTVGIIGNALTGETLVPTYDDLLPPAEAFSDSGSDDNDSGFDVNNDGDPSNDTGNAGWGFTSIADMFDGGGPGTSGDAYAGGIHGSGTAGSVAEGPTSVASSWFGGGSSDDGGGSDSGGGSDDGGCVIGTYALTQGLDLNRNGAVKWCVATLHDHWIGETIRMGYQHWGRKQIASGKAEDRFKEFQNFADFVSGKDKSIVAGTRVYARMTQCFVIGLTRRVINAST